MRHATIVLTTILAAGVSCGEIPTEPPPPEFIETPGRYVVEVSGDFSADVEGDARLAEGFFADGTRDVLLQQQQASNFFVRIGRSTMTGFGGDLQVGTFRYDRSGALPTVIELYVVRDDSVTADRYAVSRGYLEITELSDGHARGRFDATMYDPFSIRELKSVQIRGSFWALVE